MEKNPMHYRVQARNLRSGELTDVIQATRSQACFADMALRNMNDQLRVHEFDWHFEVGNGVNRSTVEEVREMIGHFYPEDQREGMTIEFIGVSEITDVPREVVRFSNMGEYPRGLFMAKLFTIRNLNRYCESYLMYQKLLKVGVPKKFAVVMGANIHSMKNFRGDDIYTMRDYARTINAFNHTMADWRNHAENAHLGQLGYKWGDGKYDARGGYNRAIFDGAERALKKLGYTNSQTVTEFVKSSGVQTSNLTWKGVMGIAANLTRKGYLADKPEPTKEEKKAVAQGLNPNRLP